jgi:non-ribosomal peptide synthetase component F
MDSNRASNSNPHSAIDGYAGIHRQAPKAAHHVILDRGILQSRLHVEVEKRVKMQPDQIALQDSEYSFTYQELDQEADRIAHAVRTALIARHGEDALAEQRAVSLFFGFSVYSVVAMLGVLKTGMLFLAMDPSHPRARNTFMLSDSRSEILLTREKFLPEAEEMVKGISLSDGFQSNPQLPKIITIESIKSGSPIPESRNELLKPAGAISNLVYTSGSTGQPKGVIQTHANILHNDWQISLTTRFGPGEHHAKLNTVVPSGAIVRIFAVLICGASLHLYNIKENGVMGLPEWLQKYKITTLNAQPPLFRFICHALLDMVDSGENPFSGLRMVSVGGERARKSDFELFKRCFPPGVILRHGGGSTEAGAIAESYLDHKSQIGEFGIPWGYPTLDKQILIWDDNGEPLPTGEVAAQLYGSRPNPDHGRLAAYRHWQDRPSGLA